MRSHHFNMHDLITVLRLLEIFHQTGNNNGFHEGVAMWILP